MAAKLLGAQVKRKEDPRLITGTSQYVADIALPGLLHVAFVRSPHAHARIRGIERRRAQALPGVVAVVTGRDLMPHVAPDPGRASAEGGGEAKSEVGRQHYPLSVDRVRYVGEAVAAVIGRRPRPRSTAPPRSRWTGSRCPRWSTPFPRWRTARPSSSTTRRRTSSTRTTIKAGDPDAAFAKAHRVVKQRMVSQRLSGVPDGGARRPRRARLRQRRAHGVGDAPGAARAPHRAVRRAPPSRESDPRHRARGGRRLRREVRHLSRGRGGGRAGAPAARAAPVDRDARRAHDDDHPRPRPDHRHGGGGGRGRPHHRAPHARPRRHRRLSDLHLHPGPHADDGRRRLRREGRGSQEHLRLHQYDLDRRLPRRRPAGGRLLSRAARGLHRHGARPAARGDPPEELHPAERPSPTRRRPDSTTTAASTTGRWPSALEVSRYARSAPSSAAASRRTTGRSSASAWPATSRCAASVPTRAPWCASSRAAPSPRSPARRPTARGTRPRSPRSSPTSSAWSSTR